MNEILAHTIGTCAATAYAAGLFGKTLGKLGASNAPCLRAARAVPWGKTHLVFNILLLEQGLLPQTASCAMGLVRCTQRMLRVLCPASSFPGSSPDF